MSFKPFGKLVSSANKEYYRRKGLGLYDDFETAASKDCKIAAANALEIHFHLEKLAEEGRLPNEVHVLECGCGNGAFATDFLDSLQIMDESQGTSFYPKIRYTLGDISRKLLKQVGAKKKVRGHKIRLVQMDALKPVLKEKLLYARFNELWDDLPARLLGKVKGKIVEFKGRVAGKSVELKAFPVKKPSRLAARMLASAPEGYAFPFNEGVVESLRRLKPFLDRKRGARLDSFDYGFNSFSEALEESPDFWNATVSRVYGTQVTVDLNFPFLLEAAKEMGLNARVEKTVDYLERVLGQALFPVGNGYLSREELLKKKGILEKKGFSKDFFEGKIREEDAYFRFTAR